MTLRLVNCSLDRNKARIRQERMASGRGVVILGKTGNGKSSLGNSLLGRKGFEEADGFDAVTLTTQLEENVGELAVVDTPGLFDTRDDPKKVVNGALAIIRAIDLLPEPHAFLIVFNGACRLTEEEMSVIDILRLSFGNEWIKYAIVVITHIDNKVEECKFENKWTNCKVLRKLVEECGGRVARINNANPRDEHIEKILKYVEHVSNKGMLSYKYSYMECHQKVLENATDLEKYNGMSTHELVEELARSINDTVKKEIKRQEDIVAAIKRDQERMEAQRIEEKRQKSTYGSATIGIVTGIATAGATAAVKASLPIVIGGALSSTVIVGYIAYEVIYNFVNK